ncbi:hypothetical protein N0M98_27580 [Paenibacillus doosanensis]|uniref:Uncharacterized protein n=1 Tax=Paenibacillus konkukensis TaxID=2020716 RepID=A0ABY4RTH6_9BACL|nr:MULTISPECIES: hypothetical protein [Paenibacillus]MCS7463873.1 hypothetical protein [Paenibacillus doosanensis]UQZ85737.1 hypothetical protein SK3146_05026 [Paenibacillus konkukensis]
MVAVTYSPGLHHVVRSLKQMDAQDVLNLFKDQKWFESHSLSASEGQAVMKMFAKTASDYIRKNNSISETWY